MKKLALALLSLSLLTGGGFGANAALAGNGNGNGGDTGHTPVTVCHWVPAAPAGNHQIAGPDGVGGSYVVIVVDDDGANGNKNLRAHDPSHHEHDIIGDPDCGAEVEEE